MNQRVTIRNLQNHHYQQFTRTNRIISFVSFIILLMFYNPNRIPTSVGFQMIPWKKQSFKLKNICPFSNLLLHHQKVNHNNNHNRVAMLLLSSTTTTTTATISTSSTSSTSSSTGCVDLNHVEFTSLSTTSTTTNSNTINQSNKNGSTKFPAIFLHGLLGNKRNFATIGRSLAAQLEYPRPLLSLDLRNHGMFCIL